MLVARGDADGAARLLEGFLQKHPAFEGTYITLAKIYLAAGGTAKAIAVLERLLQRNPEPSGTGDPRLDPLKIDTPSVLTGMG